ncbi:uncharacterized protein STEHIDRAFT_109263 [Stereum hirsutum FP-91666 SS1]|uniref:uncharacterized protein n=1 Tax=Stereum hirsutum (strain FP-91666) TaxID=721885 RepID=UPI00044104D0|nr:uncharacterized protein STEHIDRAFT_109263 [Stereum hirsutum FP-91666 SS1]EIM88955.1 hypothetical protein STEHIDRAFT_109263 [Stereum hirsutum FP-91666 SS1]
MARNTTFPKSRVLVLAVNAVQSLLPTTLIAQAESLLESHKVDELVQVADEQRKKLQAKLTVDEDDTEELYYVYQRIGFQYLSETRFEDAGYHLFEGNLDPRVLISYFPDLRGKLIARDEEIEMFEGVAEHMPPYDSVEDIVIANIARTYSPYITPNTRSAPPTAELRRILLEQAVQMLAVFLGKWKRVRGEGEGAGFEVLTVVDTVLAKLHARSEHTPALYALIRTSPYLVLSELEPVFVSTGQYNALCTLYANRGEDGKVLEVWGRLVDGEWTDPDIPDPLTNMFDLLTDRKDRQLTQKWGIWLTRKDSERAINLLTSQAPPAPAPKAAGKRSHAPSQSQVDDDMAMLAEIRAANPEAGVRFLEHLVLGKRSVDRDLHTELALICVEQVRAHLRDDAVYKLWRAKAASYASTATSHPSSSSHPTSTSTLTPTPTPTPTPGPTSSSSSSSPPQTPTANATANAPASPSPPPLSRTPSAAPLPTASSTALSSSQAASAPSSSSAKQDSYISYFSKTTPDSASKRARLRGWLFLQGSGLYDVAAVKAKLCGGTMGGDRDGKEVKEARERAEKVLGIERAIVEGKLKNHKAALTLLALTTRDHASAETYCLTRGSVITQRLARKVVEKNALGEAWAGFVAGWGGGGVNGKAGAGGAGGDGGKGGKGGGVEEEEETTRLLRMLLGVYVGSGGESDTLQAPAAPTHTNVSANVNASANLLSSQSGRFDLVEVVDVIPPEWPLKALSAFLSRSFRRTLHARHEGLIMKGIAMGQNLAVSEEAHIHFRDAGAIIEEALPPSPSSPSYDAYMEKEKIAGRGLGGEGEGEGEEEHVVLDEKAALAAGLELEAAEVHVGDGDGDEDSEGGDGDGQGGGERGIADRERGGDEDEEEGDGDGGDDGFGDFQGGGGDGETVAGTGAVPIPNLLDTLKGIDGRGGLSMSYDSEVTEPEQHRDEGVDGVDARAGGGEEDWLGGLR